MRCRTLTPERGNVRIEKFRAPVAQPHRRRTPASSAPSSAATRQKTRWLGGIAHVVSSRSIRGAGKASQTSCWTRQHGPHPLTTKEATLVAASSGRPRRSGLWSCRWGFTTALDLQLRRGSRPGQSRLLGDSTKPASAVLVPSHHRTLFNSAGHKKNEREITQ